MIIPNRILFANIPTPLDTIKFDGKSFIIKRDDLTGVELSGNKVRKLEYLIYQAKKEKSDYIFTTGGDQSNHARATAVAAAKFGIKSKLFLWGKNSGSSNGNLFIDKFLGADISFLNKEDFGNVNQIMFEERAKYVKRGRKVFVIPEGGSTTLGIWGYINFIEELKNQIEIRNLRGIFSASGSGGTAAGLLVGAALSKVNLKIFAVNVLYSKEKIKKKIIDLAEGCVLDYKLSCRINEDNLEIIDGYSKEGYKNINEDKLTLIKRFARESGIILDPAYTGKAFAGYYETILNKNDGKKVLFLHTGGIFGVFGKRTQYLNAR
ncbi:MAG TPA: pyridoxal-phosphate dependent enzyme [Ignavibacteriaceae bacterium]|nr:pyridoxal-phosphate dependent enzyme [Ignavibacteriaceae bacterium]